MPSNSDSWATGNVLGAARAEADNEMLSRAFVETSDFQALRTTDHFNFVVGRRGTGKTALFLRCLDEFEQDKKIFAHMLKPEEHHSLALVSLLRKLGDGSYRTVRSITRILWRGSVLLSVAGDLCNHWKYRQNADVRWLQDYTDKRRQLLRVNELERCTILLRQVATPGCSQEELPSIIASVLNVNALEKEIRKGLATIDMRALFLFDGLDDGWHPDAISTAVLGGLAITVADFADHDLPVHGELFVRDNIFRYLAVLDSDFSRHIEGSTLRLNWNEDGLLNLIATRLRVVFDMSDVENNNRVWNRFAHHNLRNREGFRSCLQHTLYRPRDLLVLLNGTAVHAARAGRTEIVEEDIEATSKQISIDRLADLLKEYESVFPGLEIIANHFAGSDAFQNLDSVRNRLEILLSQASYSTPQASDLAVLNTSSQLIDALYSVGFLGLEDPGSKAVLFCHDGASSSISDVEGTRRVAIHPCYWKALDVRQTGIEPEVLLDIHDDYESRVNPDLNDIRTKRLGQLVSDLPATRRGPTGAAEYERWVLQACQILFAGDLSDFQLHPAPGGVARRDIVATNCAERGFWKRVRDEYRTHQVVFETKNDEDLEGTDYLESLGYDNRQFGQLIVVVTRSTTEALDRNARASVKEIWDTRKVLLFVIPATMLMQCIRKYRTNRGRSYTDRVFMKRLDTFERSYLALRHVPKRVRKKRKS